MKVRQFRIDLEILIYMMLVGMLAIQIGRPLQINSIVSLGTWLIIISIIISFCLSLALHKINARYFLDIIILAMCVVVSILASFSWKYQSIISGLSFLEIPLLMAAYPKILKKNILNAIFACFIILSIYYQYLSVSTIANISYTEYGKKYVDFLTLGYENPNETAMHLIVCFFVLALLSKRIRNIWLKLIITIDLCLIARLIILTLSRTAILILILFVVFSIIFAKKSIPSFIRIGCFLVPLIFVLLNFIQEFFDIELFILGELLDTGRWDIYVAVFKEMNFIKILFGEYNYGFQNLHNAFLSIFATIGIIGVIVFISFLYNKTCEIQKKIENKDFSQPALIGMLCIVAYTATEAAFFTAGGSFAIAFISLYFLSVFNG